MGVLAGGGRREFALDYLHHLYDVAGDEDLTDSEWRVLLQAADNAVTGLRVPGPGTEQEVAEIRALLERTVAVQTARGGAAPLGGALYTLANHLYNDDGSVEATRAAVGYYNRARKHDPAYCDRAYFASELGGALFGVSPVPSRGGLVRAGD